MAVGYSKDIRASEVIDNPELNHFDRKTVSVEIDYLAGKKFIMGSSSTGQSPYDWLKISAEGVEIIRSILEDYPNLMKDRGDEESRWKYDQILATRDEIGRRREIYADIKNHLEDLEDYLVKTRGISVNPIAYNSTKPESGNIYNTYTGDVFQNIQNSNIVSRSSIENAFNKLNPSDQETRDALVKVAEFINRSEDPAAGALFNNFADELTKPSPDKTRLSKFWTAIEKLLPTINTVAGILSKTVIGI